MSADEILQGKDFAQMTAEEIAQGARADRRGSSCPTTGA